MIPFFDLAPQNSEVVDRVLQRMSALAEDSVFVGGEPVHQFEKAFAAFSRAAHCVALNSGTDALRLSLLALDLPGGSEVITTPFSFIAAVEAIRQANLRPCFADIDPDTLNLCAESVGHRFRKSVSCILPVHLGGNPCRLDALRDASPGALMVEDACQAHGSRYGGRGVGTWGEIGAFSFYPTKSLGAWGDAGAAVTSSESHAEALRRLRNHGQTGRYFHQHDGWNSRMDAFQAVVLSAKLERLEAWIRERLRLSGLYDTQLGEIGEIKLIKKYATAEPVPYLYTIRAEGRDRLRRHLQDTGIGTEVIYPYPLHLLPACRDLGYAEGDFPAAEKSCHEVLSLPLYPGLRECDVHLACEEIRKFYR